MIRITIDLQEAGPNGYADAMKTILISLLIAQALFLSAWLHAQGGQRALRTWLLVLAAHMGANLLAPFGLWAGLAPALAFLHGPCLYFLVRERTLAVAPATGAVWPHGLPATLAVLVGILAPGLMLGPAVAVQFLAYWSAGYLLLRRHRRQLSQVRTGVADLGWLRRLMWVLAAVALLDFVRIPLQHWDFEQSVRVYQLVLLALLAGLYGLLWQGLRQPQMWSALVPEELELASSRASLEGDHAAAWAQRLQDWEARQPFLDPELTLAALAAQWGDAPRFASQLIVRYSGASNFRDFVNRARVAWACAQLDAGRADKLLTLATDAGFNSKSVFNEAFKRHTGMSPSAYRQRRPPLS